MARSVYLGGMRPSSLVTSPDLEPLLCPRSIALVGASARADTNGLALVQMARIDGYAGRVYPVNPGYAGIEGLACYPDLASLPERPDHVVLSIANAKLEAGLDAAIAVGAKAVTIFASGHLDDDTDPPLVERLRHKAQAAGIALCGPNCMGFYVPPVGLRIASFPSPPGLRRGGIAWLAQSGSAFSALCHNDRRLGFSLCVSTGAESVVTVADYMYWAVRSGATRVIGLFLESVRSPDRFKAALEAAAEDNIPVIALKVGRTAASAAMAATHTGALAGNDAAYRALFRTYGVHQVDDLDEMTAALALFDTPRRAGRGGLATLHDSGGEREMIVDLAERHGVPFGKISDATKTRLAGELDPGLHPENPLDAWGTARDFSARFQRCIAALSADPDVALTIFNSDVRDGYWYHAGVVDAVIGAATETEKPLAIVSNTHLTNDVESAARLAAYGIPLIKGTQAGLKAVAMLLAHRDGGRRAPPSSRLDARVIDRWRLRLGSAAIDEADGLGMLADFGLDVPRRRIVTSVTDAVEAARAIGGAVALKTAESHAHKTEVGGVRLGLVGDAAVRAAYEDLASRLGPRVLVAAMAPKGVEVGVGAFVDPSFGPVIMLSAGGTLIEVLADTATALAPLSEAEASRMLDGLKVSHMLAGVRGAPAADTAALARWISQFSAMVASLADALAEIDVNPVIASPSGAVAVDALVIPARRG
jgi:acyl-CoA synthetase (NDP forming)